AGSDEEEEEELEEDHKEPRIRETPEDLVFEAIVNTIAFHPTREVLAAGDLDGDVYVYSYSPVEGGNQELWSSGHHLKSCREVAFSHDGQKLFTVSKDKSVHLLDVEEGKLIKRFSKAHSTAINSLLLIDENLFATGDDNGTLKVWDLRKEAAFMETRNHEEYISDITIDQNKKLLLTTRRLQRLGVLLWKRWFLSSEPRLGCSCPVCVMRERGKKVVCGSSEGMIYLFNWDGFGATSDRFAVKAESIDCIVPISNNVLCAASMDGVIRFIINILPNRVIGSVGQHAGEPIEQIAQSRDGRLLASCAHDQKVKFWDIASLHSTVVDDYRCRKKCSQLKSLSKKAFGGGEDFFADLLEEKPSGAEGTEQGEENEDSD
uniref:WD repeat domain 55 n=1 Tax=Latimeria chalumnae TaxID=7897 RepID=H2ZRM7_LATCH